MKVKILALKYIIFRGNCVRLDDEIDSGMIGSHFTVAFISYVIPHLRHQGGASLHSSNDVIELNPLIIQTI